jgi:hypothetical protein
MAIDWGSWEGPTYGQFRVGIDVSRSGKVVTVKYYVQSSDDVSDTQTLTLTGDVTGTYNFSISYGGSGGTKLVATRSGTVSPSSDYVYRAYLSGVYNGATPQQVVNYTAPGVPDKPATPTVSSVDSNSYTLNWVKPDGNGDTTNGVQQQTDNHSGFTSPLSDYNDSTSPSYPFSAEAGVAYDIYYSRVRGYNDMGYGPWSDAVATRLDANKPSAPPTPSATVISESITVIAWGDPSNWGGDNSSDFYLQVDNNSGFTSPHFAGSVPNANSKIIDDLAPLTTYYARVLATNAAGNGSWSAVRTFTTFADYPSTPGTPSSTPATDGKSTTLAWTDPSDWGGDNTSSFDLQGDDNIGFSSPTTKSIGGNTHAWTGLTPGLTYYFRVRAKNARGVGDWSAIRTVEMYDVPNEPTDLIISEVTATGFKLNYTQASDNGGRPILSDIIELGIAGDFTSPVTITDTDLSHIFTDLEPNVNYSVRVKATNSVGSGPWSLVESVDTLASFLIKKDGVWKTIVQIFIKKNGVWKEVTDVFIKDGAVWKD